MTYTRGCLSLFIFLFLKKKKDCTSSTTKWSKSQSSIQLLPAPLWLHCAAERSTLSATAAMQHLCWLGFRGRGGVGAAAITVFSSLSQGKRTETSNFWEANPRICAQPRRPCFHCKGGFQGEPKSSARLYIHSLTPLYALPQYALHFSLPAHGQPLDKRCKSHLALAQRRRTAHGRLGSSWNLILEFLDDLSRHKEGRDLFSVHC